MVEKFLEQCKTGSKVLVFLSGFVAMMADAYFSEKSYAVVDKFFYFIQVVVGAASQAYCNYIQK